MIFTLILVIMTGIISYQAFTNPIMKQRLIFHPASVHQRGEWYRFLTHGFIHADWQHLIINVLVLYMFGENIEGFFQTYLFGATLSKIMFLLFYLSAIVVAAIPSYLKNKDNLYYASLGASGATSALVFAYILLDPWAWFAFPPLPAIVVAIGYLWYSNYMSKRGADNIAHDAHLWGAVYGLLFMLLSAVIFRPALLDFFLSQLMKGPTPPPFF